MTARDAVRRAHSKVRGPNTIHIVAGADHPELPEDPVNGWRAAGVFIDEFDTLPAGPPKDYAEEPAEALPPAPGPMLDTLAKILLGSIVALAATCFWLGFTLGGG